MRGSKGGAWRYVFQAALAALFAFSAITASAAIFDDGNDRHFVTDLREKDPGSLTDEEKAILAAANNVGIIRVCDGLVGGNAFYLSYGGRPAVITSAHLLVDDESGEPSCSSERMTKAFYYPNASYYEPGNKDNEYALKRHPIIFPAINLPTLLGDEYKTGSQTDWAIFLLGAEIATNTMPDGSKRGSLDGSFQRAQAGKLMMIGVAPDMGRGNRTLFQRGCDYIVKKDLIRHNCDTIRGSSGSVLGVYEDGEIRIRGLHNFSVMGNEKLAKELATLDNIGVWNGGALIETILADAEKPLPEFLAYDIQLRLSRAGCYSGKLDNQWGPGSRKALAAFAAAAATELPGTEPSAELLAAVEKLAPEGTEMCRR